MMNHKIMNIEKKYCEYFKIFCDYYKSHDTFLQTSDYGYVRYFNVLVAIEV